MINSFFAIKINFENNAPISYMLGDLFIFVLLLFAILSFIYYFLTSYRVKNTFKNSLTNPNRNIYVVKIFIYILGIILAIGIIALIIYVIAIIPHMLEIDAG
jgi:hypothetical protein